MRGVVLAGHGWVAVGKMKGVPVSEMRGLSA
jgi:hypothetical protein